MQMTGTLADVPFMGPYQPPGQGKISLAISNQDLSLVIFSYLFISTTVDVLNIRNHI
jgi:hypothetical protein